MNIRTMAIAAAAFFGTVVGASAQIVPGAVALADSITGTRTLSADTVYQLVNTVKVGPGAVLNIPAGTLIYGNKDGVRSSLQIERDGKIHAQGTASAPIIFTSAQPQGQKAPGDWGGIIILGKANVNQGGNVVIEGGTNGIFGGTDDTDSSGVLSYVRIEYGGLAFSPNNEINGLTLAGVGNRTKIDHIQVSYSNDDSYEWFGGTVNGKYLIAYAGLDDDIDTDFGYRGRLQFFFGFRDSSKHDVSTSNGMEADNDATGTLRTPTSTPIISNLTLVGPFSSTSETGSPQWGRGGHWRRSTRYGLFNSVITGFQEGLRIDGGNGDLDSIFVTGTTCPQPTNFHIRNTVITGVSSEVRGVSGVLQASADAWFDCAAAANVRGGNHSGAGLLAVGQSDLTNPDARPNTTTSPARNGSDYTDGMLAAGNNFTFTNVGYKGAFDPNGPQRQWDSAWSQYAPHTTTYVKFRSGWNMVALANTPSNSSKDQVFPNNTSNAFKYSGGYITENTLVAGRGYFLKLGDNAVNEQTGTSIPLGQTVNVVAGWNMISTGSTFSAQTANVVTGGGTTITSQFFGFNGGYQAVTTLEPGKAYWVKVSANGTLTIN